MAALSGASSCASFSDHFCSVRQLIVSTIRLVDVDDFIAELWKVHVAVKKEGYVQVRCLEVSYPADATDKGSRSTSASSDPTIWYTLTRPTRRPDLT